MFEQETIAAIATSSKNGSISVIRVSGENSFSIVSRIFCNEKGNLIDLNEKKSHTIQYGFIFDGSKKIDEVLVLLMKAPKSYTAEDVVEIQCHGGHYICQVILDLLVRHGVRVAEPGEFTKRAFLNGRLDLSQAEAVIQSKSELALSNSMSQLRGSIKNRIQKLREVILEDVAYLEAALDDPEHISLDSFDETIEGHVRALLKDTNHLLENCNNGRIMKEGIQTVIVGKPNVGKSSLLNCLLRENRAIVTNIPGTTRDTLEEDIVIGNILLHLIDTAGIRETENEIESIGIKKTKESLEKADFVIIVLDSSKELSKEDYEILDLCKNSTGVVLVNKSDLQQTLSMQEICNLSGKDVISFSAAKGDGLDELESYIKRQFIESKIEEKDDLYITNARQKEALVQTKDSLEKVLESIEFGMPEDLYAIDLTNAYESLGKIIGETLEEDIINKIFKDWENKGEKIMTEQFDAIVIGAGHAGCEAALALARLSCKTALFTVSVDSIAMMPCNPNVGGTSKGHLVREIDALGGEMGKNIDRTFIQSKMLNQSKGPAVHSLRAQADKKEYSYAMRKVIEETDGVSIKQGEITDIIVEDGKVYGVKSYTGAIYPCKVVVLCTGTYLNARCITGETSVYTGPNGLQSATHLTDSLKKLGISMRRFKTGTPARMDGRTIDYSKMEPQYGDEKIVPFSFENKPEDLEREQVKCWLTYTNEETHKVIRENLDRSPLYSGYIKGTGPRYCPSIEDKVVRFADKNRHQVFIEPEGNYTNEMYVGGMSSSLPEDVQEKMYRSVPGLEHAKIVRNAYAIEYDCLDSLELLPTLELKKVKGLFSAGQANGSSGYEEAAAGTCCRY